MDRRSDDCPLPFLSILQLASLVFCLCLLARSVYYFRSEGFCLDRIQTKLSVDSSFDLPKPSDSLFRHLSNVTSQPFYYLKKGSQAYAFISQDKKFVLKLFKYHHMQPAEWLLSIPLPNPLRDYRNGLVNRRRNKIDLTLNSYKIAATTLKDECALLYAQILPVDTYKLNVLIFDSVGRSHTINLANYGFAIQRTANLVLPSLERWIENNQLQEARRALDSLLYLIKHRFAFGIGDLDPDLHKNAGLIGTSAIFIDIGSFLDDERFKERKIMNREVSKTFSNLRQWLNERSPELAKYLENILSNPVEGEGVLSPSPRLS